MYCSLGGHYLRRKGGGRVEATKAILPPHALGPHDLRGQQACEARASSLRSGIRLRSGSTGLSVVCLSREHAAFQIRDRLFERLTRCCVGTTANGREQVQRVLQAADASYGGVKMELQLQFEYIEFECSDLRCT